MNIFSAMSLLSLHGIIVGAVGCTKARHSNAHYTLAIVSELVECLNANQQCQCGIQPATYAEHHTLAVGMNKTFGESAHLNREYLVARSKHVVACRNKWMRIYFSHECKFAWLHRLCGNEVCLGSFGCINKRCVLTSLCAELLYIYLIDYKLLVEREMCGLGNKRTILVDIGIAAINHILCALAKTA